VSQNKKYIIIAKKSGHLAKRYKMDNIMIDLVGLNRDLYLEVLKTNPDLKTKKIKAYGTFKNYR